VDCSKPIARMERKLCIERERWLQH
jgi:hypothetical protein